MKNDKLRNPMREYVIAFQPFTSDKEYLANLSDLGLHLSYLNYNRDEKLQSQEKDFIVIAHRLFEKKFPNSSINQKSLSNLAGLLGWLGDDESRMKVLQEIIDKYPTTSEYEREALKRLKKSLSYETGGMGK